MIIGILYEGGLDLPAIKTIIKRIRNGQEDILKLYEAKGQIITKMDAALTLFKELNVEVSIFVSDIDDFPKRKNQIKSFIKKHPEMKIISAFCEPHFEEWFVVEKNTIVSLLGINPELSFKNDSQRHNPKGMVEKFINEKIKNTNIVVYTDDIYSKISETLNLEELANKDKNFKNFKQELERLNQVI